MTFDLRKNSILENLIFFASLMLMLLALFVGVVSYKVERITGEYIKIRPDGIYTRVAALQREGRTVLLIGMAHVARKGFYDDVINRIPTTSLVLEEGVSDRDHLLPDGLDYTHLGLSTLDDQKNFMGKLRASRHTVNADIDVNQLKPANIEFLRAIGRYLKGDQKPLENNPSIDSDFIKSFFDDVLDRRNEHLLNVLSSQDGTYNSFTIAWGALHLASIEEELKTQGYRIESTENLKLFSFF